MGAVTVVLEWQFSPPDFFEESITISRDDYTMVIDKGKVEARIAADTYDGNTSMRTVLHEALEARFLAVQLLTRKPYQLSKSKMTHVDQDGRKHFFFEPEAGHIRSTGCPIDTQYKDKDGKVISDSRQDRIEKEKRFADLISKYSTRDFVLVCLLKSYNASVHDPDNELVHLYEIREALSNSFGGEGATRSTLGVSSSDWSRLGHLCCNEPLRQGRHRGKFTGTLRDATDGELAEARGITRVMIEAYLYYIDRTIGKTGGSV